MPETLAALLVEDSESDAELILRTLKSANYQVVSERVETTEEMEEVLGRQNWDVVISDYSLPQFNGPTALELLKQSGQDIPFIIVSGTIGEETAVQMMKAGVHDYLTKDNLARLAPAVARELEQARRRLERRKIEDTLYFLTQRIWEEDGENYFFAVAKHLGETLPVDYVVIDRVKDEKTAQTLANFWLGKARPNFEYLLEDTPCGTIFDQRQCTYAENVQEKFPKDTDLVDMGAESYSGIPLWDSRGTPIGLIAVLGRQPVKYTALVESILQIVANHVGHEIERQEAEEALRTSEERLSLFMNSASDSFYMLDANLNFIELNTKALELIGRKKEDVIGKNIADIVPDIKESGRYEKHLEVIRTGEPFVIDDFVPYPVFGDKHFVLTSFKVGNGLGVIAHDITERKQAEDALARREADLAKAQAIAHLGSYSWNIQTGEVEWSKELKSIWGFDEADLSYEKAISMIHPDDYERVLQAGRLAQDENIPFDIEYRIIRSDGSIRYLYDRAEIIRDASGTAITMFGTALDITERKQAEMQLQEQLDELRRWHHVTVGREERILALKREINELVVKEGKPPRYPSAEVDEK